ncbi:oligosaccharide flippase family protein [Vibrio lentus]|uniref:oligosaccharide flippase family protein n=1 Tax=Vibrio lentus TaxID=136468 RepID=UPI000C82A710|nr:oligosaccharide flippase family protein [Vibrio lentus]PMI85237.1 hypothetical protein BCU36_00950 [Vibrio lentus]
MKVQIIKNISMNGCSFLINLVLSLFLVPYLIEHVGIAAYGLVPLSMFFTAYIGVITQSLTMSVNKELIAALQCGDEKRANNIFNTALVTIGCISFIVLLFFVFLSGNLELFIDIPTILINDAKYLFIFVACNFSLSLITSIVSVPMYSNNRIDLMQINNIIRIITRTTSIIMLFNFYEISLLSVGLASLISGCFTFLYSIYMWRKLSPFLSINVNSSSFNTFKGLVGFGGWVFINQIGTVLFTKIDLLLTNKFFGSEYTGEYSIALQFSDLLRNLASIVGGVLGPPIMILYSRGEVEKLIKMTNLFMKFLSLCISIPVVYICVFSSEIINIWIGPDYEHLSKLIWVLTFPLIINLGVLPLFSVQVAIGKVKLPGIMNIVLGISTIVSSIFLIKNTDLGIYSIAISGGILLSLKNALFIPLYSARNIGVKWSTFIRVHLLTLIYSILLIVILFIVKRFFIIDGYSSLFYSITVFSVFSLLLTSVFYSREERLMLINVIRRR